jgi:hypothetical protein
MRDLFRFFRFFRMAGRIRLFQLPTLLSFLSYKECE